MLLNKKAHCGQVSLGGEDFSGKLDTRHKPLMISTSNLIVSVRFMSRSKRTVKPHICGGKSTNCNSAPCTRPMLFIDGPTRKWYATKSVVKKKNIYGPAVLNNFSQGFNRSFKNIY